MHELGMQNVKEIRKKIKSHQGEDSKSWKAVANDWADFYAKKGRLLHDQPTEAIEKQLVFQVRELGKVMNLVLEVFTLWPSQVKADRLPAGQRLAAKAKLLKGDGHVWQRLNGAWQCQKCLATARSKSSIGSRTTEKCKAAAEAGGLAADLLSMGHKPIEVVLEHGGQALDLLHLR